MIVGVGTDIIEIERIKKSYEQFGDRFLNRIFTAEEIAYCFSKKNPFPSLAIRFASKEALVKAAKLGKFHLNSWLDVSVTLSPEALPSFILFNDLRKELEGTQVHLSMSHAENYATAVVVIEK
jgi:holo-[acyl-carrier protein] synthase